MKDAFKAVKISESVYWVGAIDWKIRDFHGYLTSRGSTYNAFLILDEKITLLDTVKAPFKDELIARISSVIDPKKIDYIVSHHSEMDHSGCLPEIIELTKPEKVFASKMGVKTLKEHFKLNCEITQVDNGEKISLGKNSLIFYETRLLHWPESMISYMPEEKILFSQDGFGMHLANYEVFADEIEESILFEEGKKYYANILLPYSKLVLKLLENIKNLGIEIKILAPDHGPIWRKDIDKYINWYEKWAKQEPEKKAVVVYATMWGSTELMARAICEGISSKGVEVKLMPHAGSHRSDIITEVLCAGGLIVGAPTINNNMFPKVADYLSYIKGLKPQNLKGFAFGSYGWSGEGATQIQNILKEMKVEIIRDELKVKYVPNDEDLKVCYESGKLLAEKILG